MNILGISKRIPMQILENTLQKMSNIGEPQRKFLIVLMTTLMCKTVRTID